MSQHNSSQANPLLAAWQQQLERARSNPFLLQLLVKQWQRILKRLVYFYARFAELPRRNRRALQRALATSLVSVAMLLALSGAPIVLAASITVDPGAAGINPSDGCSLVEAIYNANDDGPTFIECVAGSGADTITLPAAATLNYTTYYGSFSALPDITSTITIEANGSTIQRDMTAVDPFGILVVVPGGDLTLNDATLSGGIGSFLFLGGGITNYGGSLTVNDSTISGNDGFFAGGISTVFPVAQTINRTTIRDNYAYLAGGLLSLAGTITVNDSTLDTNHTLSGGGGLLNAYADTTLNKTTVTGNEASYGGGILNLFLSDQPYTSIVRLVQSTVSSNTANIGAGILNGSNYGGIVPPLPNPILPEVGGNAPLRAGEALKTVVTIHQAHGGLAALTDEAFRVNFDRDTFKQSKISGSVARGQAHPSRQAHRGKRAEMAPPPPPDAFNAVLYVDQSTINGNTAVEDGGGIENGYNLSAALIVNSTISGNTATGGYGGGIDNYGATMGVQNTTISGNNAGSYGGGIANAYSDEPDYGGGANLLLQRTLISGNTATKGSNEVDNGGSSTYTVNDFNLFGHSGESSAQAFTNFTPGATDLVATSNGTNPKTLSSILNTTLGNNGGPTQTLALPSGSLAIDKAPDLECTPAPINGVDQRDMPRNVNGNNAPSANECDIGAYEFQVTTAVNVAGVRGIARAGKNVLNWRSTTEAQIAGFNVWRKHGDADWKKVNDKFRAAKHPGDVGGANYRFADQKTAAGKVYRYKIEVVYLDGHTDWTKVVEVEAK